MPVLRDVITRFKFDTDRRGVKRFNETMSRMRGGLKGLGRLLGVVVGTIGVSAMFKMGQTALRAQFNLRRLVGTDFEPLRQTLRQIQEEMNGIQERSGDLIRAKDFDIAAAGFFKEFGRGKQQLETFREIFRFAAIEYANTGRNVVEIFAGLQRGLISGDFGELINLPKFDRLKKQIRDWQIQQIDPQEPGGGAALKIYRRALLRIIRESAEEQKRTLGNVKLKPLVKADLIASQLKETMDNFAKAINSLLVPVLEKLNELLGIFVDKSREIEKKGLFGALVVDPAQKAVAPIMTKRTMPAINAFIEYLRQGQRDLKRKREQAVAQPPPDTSQSDGGQPPERTSQSNGMINKMIDIFSHGQPPERTAQRGVEVTIGEVQNTFNIKSSDPREVASEVKRKFDNSIKDAASAIIPTEDR